MKSIRAEAPVYYLVGLLIVAFSALLLAVGVFPFRPLSYVGYFMLFLAALALFEGPIFLKRLFTELPDSPFIFAAQFLRERKSGYIDGLPIVIAASIFMPMFSAMKSSIPYFTDFTWDQAFIEADEALFGQHAWQALQPVLGFPFITSGLSVLYHAWILLIFSGTIFFALYRPDIRLQYFTSFFLSWAVIGVCLAMAFASVGPCFVKPLLGEETFVEQMVYLRAANEEYPVLTLRVQQILLDWHYSGQHGIGRGITAMPSMHIALAAIFWLAMRRVSRLMGWVAFAFLVIIFLGSVHLAYHYAVDGIVAFVAAIAIWEIAKVMNAMPDRLSSPVPFSK